MDSVKSFNAELSSLYDGKPPISKAKMTAITRGAIKAIKFYKHVVQSVEKFILKCKSEYKVPGLYVIDSIVRQSRHQFGVDKDVFAPRFAKNMQQTFVNLFKCPPEDKSKIIRVLNLWQKNQVFAPDVVQPLFDLADPNNPIYKELGTPTNGVNNAANIIKGSPALQKTPTKTQQGNDSTQGSSNLNLQVTDPNVLAQLQQLQRLISRSGDSKNDVHFDRKLLDFDYDDDEEEVNPSPKVQQNDSVSSLLTNPEVLRQLQTLQQTMTANQEMDAEKMKKLQEMKMQEEEFDKHLAQTVPNLPFASECDFKPNANAALMAAAGYFHPPPDMNQMQQNYKTMPQFDLTKSDHQDFGNGNNDSNNDIEVINLDHGDSRSPSPRDDRHSSRRRRSRSRERSRDRSRDRRDRDRRSKRSTSRSRNRRHRSRSRERDRERGERDRKDNKEKEKEKEKETERDKERKKRGLPSIKKENLSVCSTTLWVGHLSKLVHQDDLSNTFGEFGDIVSIDLISPRGCAFIVMHRRQDAARCLTKLKNHMLNGKAITLAWAPGKGVKGKDLKDYWEGDLGVSYIPWGKIKPDIDLEMLEDGGMIDEDTCPEWMKARLQPQVPEIRPMGGVDTSQPPPMPGAGLLQTPMSLGMVNPFQFNNRLIPASYPSGMMNLPPGMMPNVSLGVPPPNMQPPLMPNQMMNLGSPFHNPQSMLAPPPMTMPGNDSNTPEANMKNLADGLMNLSQPFGLLPTPINLAPSQNRSDDMDIEMEDARHEKPLSEQLEAVMNQQSKRNDRNDRRDRSDRRDVRGNRDRRRSRSRDRERNDRNRDRDRRVNSRERNRDDRRNNDRRDRGNRWGERDRDNSGTRAPEPAPTISAPLPADKREREKALNERLIEMATGQAPPAKREKKESRFSNIEPSEIVDLFKNGPADGPPTLEYQPLPGDLDEIPPLIVPAKKEEVAETRAPRGPRGRRDEFPKGPDFEDDFSGPGPGFGAPSGPDFNDQGPDPNFDGPVPRFGPGPGFDGPGPGFDGPGPGFDGPDPDFDGPPGFCGPPGFGGPDFDGPPGFGRPGPDFDAPPGPDFNGPPGFGRPDFDGPPGFNGPPGFGGPGPDFDGPPFGGPGFDGPPFGGPDFDGPPFGQGPDFDGPPFGGPGPDFDGPPFDGPFGPMDGPPHGRGMHDFRGGRGGPRFRGRGHPPFNGPRDFGPRHMRGDFPPQRHMRMKFNQRGGPRMRGRGGWNPRFDGPPHGGPPFRGPPMFDEGPHMGPRHHGSRFGGPPRDFYPEDGPDGPPFGGPHDFHPENGPDGPRFGDDFHPGDGPPFGGPPGDYDPEAGPDGPGFGGGPPGDFNPEDGPSNDKRSRWGNNSPRKHPQEGGEFPLQEQNDFAPEQHDAPQEKQVSSAHCDEVRGGGENTPLHDEPHRISEVAMKEVQPVVQQDFAASACVENSAPPAAAETASDAAPQTTE